MPHYRRAGRSSSSGTEKMFKTELPVIDKDRQRTVTKLVTFWDSLAIRLNLIFKNEADSCKFYSRQAQTLCSKAWVRCCSLLGLWFRIPLGARISVICECCVLSGCLCEIRNDKIRRNSFMPQEAQVPQ
jgi:hypothetical protein